MDFAACGKSGHPVKSMMKKETKNSEIDKILKRHNIIKADVEFLKGGLKKKVDYEEFAALERRLALVESKIRR